MQSAVVFIGGDPPHPGVAAHLPADRWVIAADSGLDHARSLGVAVDLIVGDLDSVSPEALASASAAAIPVERHPREKDATDAELAYQAVLSRGFTRLVVVSCVGDRLDHSLGALLALAHPSLGGLEVDAWWGEAQVLVLQGPSARTIVGEPGDVVSLVPVGGPAEGITTAGLRYPLHGETLQAASSRGVSNELTGATGRVELDRGALLVIVPHALRTPPLERRRP